jgi:hypothetical protein
LSLLSGIGICSDFLVIALWHSLLNRTEAVDDTCQWHARTILAHYYHHKSIVLYAAVDVALACIFAARSSDLDSAIDDSLVSKYYASKSSISLVLQNIFYSIECISRLNELVQSKVLYDLKDESIDS